MREGKRVRVMKEGKEERKEEDKKHGNIWKGWRRKTKESVNEGR